MIVGFLPWWPASPYQILLKQELNKLGVRVIGNPPLSVLRLLIGRDGLDVVHVHWPHGNYKTTLQFLHVVILLIAYRILKNNVVWTVHELDAYESRHPRRDAWFRSIVMKLSRRLIVHGEHTRQVLIEHHDYRRPIDVARHPSYIGGYKDEVVTDRLHAIILRWLCGTPVFFVDSIYNKLSNFINTWRKDGPGLVRSATFNKALERAKAEYWPKLAAITSSPA